MKSLVVDDDGTSRIVLQEVLARYGVVHSGTDGAEAVDACRNAFDLGAPYDLICLDINMPSMNGLEALSAIRDDEQRRGLARLEGSKVIMITAADDPESIDSAFQELCDAYIMKPVDCAEFLDLVHYLCPLEEDPVTRTPRAG